MKILAITGSPFAGNTIDKINMIGDIIKNEYGMEFEAIHLRDMNLQPCKGCFVCFHNGEQNCPLKDDGPELLQKIEEADALILATPVYSMHVSYLMKRFIDRFAFIFHRPRFHGKYAAVVAVTGAIGLGDVHKYLKGVLYSWGFSVVGELGYIAAPKNFNMISMMSRKDKTRDVIGRLCRAVKEQTLPRPRFQDYIHFNFVKYGYPHFREISPTDYKYAKEKGWFDPKRNFFGNKYRSNFFYSIAASLIGRIAGFYMGRSINKALQEKKQQP